MDLIGKMVEYTSGIWEKATKIVLGQQLTLNEIPLELSAFVVFNLNFTVTLKSLTPYSKIQHLTLA